MIDMVDMIFKKIAIVPNENKDIDFVHTKHIIAYFSKKKTAVYIDAMLREFIGESQFVKYIDHADIFEICELIIVLGGNGTMIRVASQAAVKDIPMIGINLGTVGFMNEIEADEISLLDNLFTGNFKTECRMMLDVRIEKASGESVDFDCILNDVFIKGHTAKPIELTLLCDDNEVNKYRGDGIIIATPTGSTAYSMSAGGPIIDPTVECFCVTPICPHTLITCPLIFAHKSKLKIHSINAQKTETYIMVDGHTTIELDESDTVVITKSKFCAKLITIKDIAFFHTVKNKIRE